MFLGCIAAGGGTDLHAFVHLRMPLSTVPESVILSASVGVFAAMADEARLDCRDVVAVFYDMPDSSSMTCALVTHISRPDFSVGIARLEDWLALLTVEGDEERVTPTVVLSFADDGSWFLQRRRIDYPDLSDAFPRLRSYLFASRGRVAQVRHYEYVYPLMTINRRVY